jgi:hypothetical protein
VKPSRALFRFSTPQLHGFMIGRPRLMEKFRIPGVLFRDPFGRRGAVSPTRTWQIENEVRMLVEPVLAADGLNIVAVQKTSSETAIQFSEKILLTPRIEPFDILRLKSRRVWIGDNPHRLQICGGAVLRASRLRNRGFNTRGKHSV